ATLIRTGKLEIPVVELNPTVFRRKSPLVLDIVNTGIADGAFTALSRMSNRATPPAAWQLAAIWPNSVVPVRSRVSARQIRPLVAAGKLVGKAPPADAKTKLAVIGAVMSDPAFEVVDQVAGIQVAFTAQPVVLAGCGPLFRTSTVFWAASGATLSSTMAPQKDDNRSSFFMKSLLASGFIGACRPTVIV